MRLAGKTCPHTEAAGGPPAAERAVGALNHVLEAELEPLVSELEAAGRLCSGQAAEVSDPSKARDQLLPGAPLDRMAGAEEIARAMLFLASHEPSPVAGHVLFVGGGLGP
ncbi:MAG: SDR family oxidoreductase [Acidobacteriota bacterium]